MFVNISHAVIYRRVQVSCAREISTRLHTHLGRARVRKDELQILETKLFIFDRDIYYVYGGPGYVVHVHWIQQEFLWPFFSLRRDFGRYFCR